MQETEVGKEVVTHYKWMLRYAKRFCTQECDCEDLVQETVLKILTNHTSFVRSRDFKPWAVAIMSNTYCTSHARKKLLRFSNEPDVDIPSETSSIEARDALELVKRESSKNRIFSSLIYYAHGYSYEEISGIEGIPIGTVRSRISNCRKFLKGCI